MTKFFQDFTTMSAGEFPMLKFSSATYLKAKRELVVRFIISAFDKKEFDESKQAKVLKVLEMMFDGINVEAQYINTYADVSLVKNKIVEYFNKYNQMVFRRIKEDSLIISVDDKNIDVELNFETPIFKMLEVADTKTALTDLLDKFFNQKIEVSLTEKIVDLKVIEDAEDTVILEAKELSRQQNGGYPDGAKKAKNSLFDGLRLVSTVTKDKIYAKSKIDGVSQMPNYIVDIKGVAENVVLCGKASNIGKRMYKNKRYDANNAKSGAEELPLIRFVLDDTTAKIECVCFPNEAGAAAFEKLNDGDQVICIGNVSISNYNNALSYAVNAVFNCDIDFSSICLVQKLPVPENYTCILPKPCVSVEQNSLLDGGKREKIPYFEGNTFVVFDLETTGLNIENSEIIEIAACKVVDGNVTETFQTLVNPETSISAEISNITNITDDMVANSPVFNAVLPDFYKFTRDAVLVGHNIVSFDFPFITKYAEKVGYNFDNDLVDTLTLAQKYLPECKVKKLEALTKKFGISHANAHRAMADVMATYEILKIMAKRM